jgi:hypothetical protein
MLAYLTPEAASATPKMLSRGAFTSRAFKMLSKLFAKHKIFS